MINFKLHLEHYINRDGSKAAATSKIERFVIIVNGFQPLTIITKRSILGVAAVLDPPLVKAYCSSNIFSSVKTFFSMKKNKQLLINFEIEFSG